MVGAHKTIYRHRYKKQLTTIPFFFTFANAFLGFVAITQAFDGNFEQAIYFLFAAAFMDMCDGRIARALDTTSVLGLELDSLADGISFVLAPCVIWYLWYPYAIGIIGWLALACYLSAGLYRLARFNLSAKEPSEHSTGMPVPAAAISLASVILYADWITHHAAWFFSYRHLPFMVMFFLGMLMISKIPFPVFKKRRITRHVYILYAGLFSLIISVLLLTIRGYPILLITSILYIISASIIWYQTYRHASYFRID